MTNWSPFLELVTTQQESPIQSTPANINERRSINIAASHQNQTHRHSVINNQPHEHKTPSLQFSWFRASSKLVLQCSLVAPSRLAVLCRFTELRIWIFKATTVSAAARERFSDVRTTNGQSNSGTVQAHTCSETTGRSYGWAGRVISSSSRLESWHASVVSTTTVTTVTHCSVTYSSNLAGVSRKATKCKKDRDRHNRNLLGRPIEKILNGESQRNKGNRH
jgi:hypothetical protein